MLNMNINDVTQELPFLDSPLVIQKRQVKSFMSHESQIPHPPKSVTHFWTAPCSMYIPNCRFFISRKEYGKRIVWYMLLLSSFIFVGDPFNDENQV